MFTGIVTDIGTIRKATETARGRRLEIACNYDTAGIETGASISCSGVCLTVVEKGPGWFAVDVAAETLDKTTAVRWQEGAQVNLERSLRLGDELGGHIVSGHIDAMAEIIARENDGDAVRFSIRVPSEFACYIAPKGSVALEGISLTVNEVEGDVFGVCIIPHTLQKTTFGSLQAGDKINLEIDTLARYVARLVRAA